MAAKGKMEIVIGGEHVSVVVRLSLTRNFAVSVGSSIQIAIGVIPLLVLIGWAMGRELTLYFEVSLTSAKKCSSSDACAEL